MQLIGSEMVYNPKARQQNASTPMQKKKGNHLMIGNFQLILKNYMLDMTKLA